MTKCFGADGWVFDPQADVWVTPDKTGLGRRFVVVGRGWIWSHVVLQLEVRS